jgi:hypothetical protein
MYLNRNFVIFDVSELDKIDFSSVLETSAETVRRSVHGTKTFVKWEGDVPACVESLATKSEYLTYEEMIEVLNEPEWTNTSKEDM